MNAHMSMHISAHRSVHMSIHVSAHTSNHMSVYNVCKHVYTHVCTHVRVHVRTHVRPHVRTHVRIRVHARKAQTSIDTRLLMSGTQEYARTYHGHMRVGCVECSFNLWNPNRFLKKNRPSTRRGLFSEGGARNGSRGVGGMTVINVATCALSL